MCVYRFYRPDCLLRSTAPPARVVWLIDCVAFCTDRRADLWLDGALVANNVGFASKAAQRAEQVHLFSFDPGTVWWDDIAIRYL